MIGRDSNLRRRLGRDPLAAAWMVIGSTTLVELAALAEADVLVIDLQHGLWDRKSLELAVGIVPAGTSVLVRVAENSPAAIGQALDTGAEGVIVPLVETAAEAEAAIAAARFPPLGKRSGGGVRPLAAGFMDYCTVANVRTLVGVMIETGHGVDNAEQIVRTPGLDFVLIGTGDLALSLRRDETHAERHEEACARVLAACRGAGLPCAIFTTDADQATARVRQGYAMVVPATDVTVVTEGFRSRVGRFRDALRLGTADAQTAAPAPVAVPAQPSAPPAVSTADLLAQFASAIGEARIRVIDLTQTLRPSTPVISLPLPYWQTSPFSITEISHYDERGPAWYWNNLAMGEHTGTHFDAPAHWVSGQYYPDGFTDTLAVQRLVAPACVIDCSAEVAADEQFLLEPAHIEAWETQHGRIPDGAWVLMRTGWSKRENAAAFLNMREDGPHVPGPSAAAMAFLVQHREINGWGVEAVGTDAGKASTFEPAFPAHHLLHGAKKFGLASLCNLDLLPPTGAVLITPPLKIENGSGSPLRVLALVPG